MRKARTLALAMLLLGIVPAAVLAAPEAAPAAGEAKPEAQTPIAKAVAIIGACLGAGVCAVGGGLSIARIGGSCIESMARQPEAAGAMFAPMIVTAAMVEGGMLFAIVVCLLGVLYI